MQEENWKTPMVPAMPCNTCKKGKNGETRSKTNDFKSKFPCILEASESTRMRMEESLPNYPARPQIVFELSFLPAGIIISLTFCRLPGIN